MLVRSLYTPRSIWSGTSNPLIFNPITSNSGGDVSSNTPLSPKDAPDCDVNSITPGINDRKCAPDSLLCCPNLPSCETIIINDGDIESGNIKISCRGDRSDIQQCSFACVDGQCTKKAFPLGKIPATGVYRNDHTCDGQCKPATNIIPPSSHHKKIDIFTIIIYILIVIIIFGMISIGIIFYKSIKNRST